MERVLTRAWNQIISTDDTPYYHCIARCVRRVFLCGEDPLTLRSYEHRASGRAIRDDKRGYIAPQAPQILERLGIEPNTWLQTVRPKGIHMPTVLGEAGHK